MNPSQAPDGFSQPAMRGFVGENGGLLRRDDGDVVRFGFLVEERHCNPAGTCHGGWLATMADVQLVFESCRQTGLAAAEAVTVSLSVDYLAAARIGDWIESTARVIRRTRSLIFAEGTATNADGPILRMNGIILVRQA